MKSKEKHRHNRRGSENKRKGEKENYKEGKRRSAKGGNRKQKGILRSIEEDSMVQGGGRGQRKRFFKRDPLG